MNCPNRGGAMRLEEQKAGETGNPRSVGQQMEDGDLVPRGGRSRHELLHADAMELSRRTYRLASGTLPMPALAGVRQVIDGHALTVRTTIFAARRYWAFAPRTRALLGFLFGHDCILWRSVVFAACGIRRRC